MFSIFRLQPGKDDSTDNMVNPELSELYQELSAHGKEIAELRGNIQQMDKLVSSTNRQSTL